jgi:hypothetical protein
MTAVTDIDPGAFLVVPARTFEDLRVGEVFRAPNSGDTLYSALTITGLQPTGDDGILITAVTVHNQRGQLVLSGKHKYLLRRQRATPNGDG